MWAYVCACVYMQWFYYDCLFSDDAPFSKLKVNVAGSLKALLARQQKQKEEEEKTNATASSPQEGTVYCYAVIVQYLSE